MSVTPVSTLQSMPRRDAIYDFLRCREPAGLYVDIGAASGEVSARIAAGAAELLAFEPFPANVKLFRKRLADYPNVRLVEKAVSNRRGRTTFFVNSTVQGDEPGWTDQVGYSSVGKIENSALKALRNYALTGMSALRHKRGATILRVSTTNLDAEIGDRTVDFMKVDVQGAERQVLEGARLAIESQRIRLMYLEWSGDPQVESLLRNANYSIYDSVYVGSGSAESRREFESCGFEVIALEPLSIGQAALEMVYRGSSSDVGSVLRKLNRPGRQWIQTDLVALPAADSAEYAAFLRAP